MANACFNSSPAHGPLESRNKYSEWLTALVISYSTTRAYGRMYTKYWAQIWLNSSGKTRTMNSVLPRRFWALSYVVKKHIRPLITYQPLAEYTLLLALVDPNSGPLAGWPPWM